MIRTRHIDWNNKYSIFLYLFKNLSLYGQVITNISENSKGDFHQGHFTGKYNEGPGIVPGKIKKNIIKREHRTKVMLETPII